jgi:hypothetical protein
MKFSTKAGQEARRKKDEIDENYGGGEGMPLNAFRILNGVFGAGLATMLWQLHRCDRLPESISSKDLALLSLASHKLARTLTSDQVMASVRAPFTTYEGPAGHGSVKEKPRGKGLQRAIGELLTCPYCVAVWTSASLTMGYLAAPRVSRAISSFLTVDLTADYLNILWARTADPD